MRRTFIGCTAALVAVCLCAPSMAANPGDVIITEMMINTGSSEVAPFPSLGEWIEIYNTTANDIDLTGWYFADEDGRSGDLESFVLPAHGIAVLISVGNGTNTLSKVQFNAAWGTPTSQLVQPTATNDLSGPRPTNLAQGGIAGSGLSNSPTNDDTYDDLANTPFGTPPCAYVQDYCVRKPDTTIPDGEVELLVDSTNVIIDKVHYTSSGANGRSMVLNETKLNATDNDAWTTNWFNATAGQKWAHACTITAPFTYADVGSPGQIETVTVGNQAPAASSFTKPLPKGGTVDIYLAATDDGLPTPPTINYIITSLPANGTLTAVDAAHVITAGELPYTIPSQMKLVRYTNDGTSGNTSVTYKASDTELESGIATVDLPIEEGGVIITEIMYNPASDETSPAITEWVEIYNATGSAIDVTNWYLKGAGTNRGGDFLPASIPAGGVAVVIPPGNGTTRIMSSTVFQSAWGTMPLIIQESINNQLPTGGGGMVGGNLVNSGGTPLQLIDGTGKVQDMASYSDTGSWPTVATADGTSIYLEQGMYTAGDNNDGANWAQAWPCAGGATVTLPTADNPPYNLQDKGSPGYLVGVSTGNRPPAPQNMYVTMVKDTTKTFSLTVCDDAVGSPSYAFTIVTLPLNGGLKDPNAGNADITTVPYVLAGDSVTYTPNAGWNSTITPGAGTGNGTENNDTFTYTVEEVGGLAAGVNATVNLIVQVGGVVITEIMYDPSHGTTDNDWEWLEITNTTGTDVYLNGLLNANLKSADASNLSFSVGIPAYSTRVICSPDTVNRTVAEFLTEWTCSGLVSGQLLTTSGTKPAFSNSGDTLFITDFSNNVIDRVHYSNNYSGWPASTNSASIYLNPNLANVVDNDDVANWQLSVDGVASACATPDAAGDPTDSDVGSPAIIPATCTPASISVQPGNQTVTSPATATFTVTATGSPTLAYQWRKGGTNLVDGALPSGAIVAGALTDTLTISNTQTADTGASIDVVVDNGCGSPATSTAATLTVNPAPVTITAWRSIKTHSGAGAMAIALNAAAVQTGWATGGGGIKVESRNSTLQNGLRQIQVDFSGAVTLVNPAGVAVTGAITSGCNSSGANCVQGPTNSYAATAAMVDADTMDITFANSSAPDYACYVISIPDTVLNIAISGDRDCKVRMLQGDSTQDGQIVLGDLSQIKGQFSQPITTVNAKSDVNLAGGIALADMSLTKARFGRKALCP